MPGITGYCVRLCRIDDTGMYIMSVYQYLQCSLAAYTRKQTPPVIVV